VSDIDGVTVYHNYEHHLQSINPHTHPEPFVLRQWLKERAGTPGMAGFVYQGDCQFQLQVRTGPQSSTAFHVQSGEEWLYVLNGSATVRVIDGREVHMLALPDGSGFLVAGGSPKSLQLAADATVLVMTRQRKTPDTYPHHNKTHTVPHLTHWNQNAAEPMDEPDKLLWLCGQCGAVAHSTTFECTDYCQWHASSLACLLKRLLSSRLTLSLCGMLWLADTQSQQLTSDFEKSAAAGDVKCAACSAPYVAAASTAASASLPASAPAFPSISSSTHPVLPYHLLSWIESNRHLLAPPVGNKMLHGRGAQWKVMIVGGPNERTDYHIDDGEESDTRALSMQHPICL